MQNYLNLEIKSKNYLIMPLPKEFVNWYNTLKIVKANKGPANGSIATALIVLNRLQNDYDLEFKSHLAKGGMQIRGASGAAVAAILKSFGEVRPFAKEGGRTNRGGPTEVRLLLESLRKIRLDRENKNARNRQLRKMQSFLIDRIKEFHNRQKIKLTFNPNYSSWHIVHNLLLEAAEEGKSGYVAQHLVGAKLQLRFPDILVSNESGSTADAQTLRPGDFLIGHTAFHVTVAPMQPVYEKCMYNIRQGLKPFLLVPDNKLIGVRQIAEQTCEQQIAVESIESFVSQNINEISVFNKDNLKLSFMNFFHIYNQRVDDVEIDKSLMIDLPKNLQ